jgi:uncharacterized membrane protein YcaP (DUF421 family)
MEPWQIKADDWKRIVIGDVPTDFMLEVFFRTIIIYFILLVIVRWLGKRMSGQLTQTEMAVMLTLGAIVSAPMQLPERGILQGILVLLCILAYQRIVNYYGVINPRWESFVNGEPTLLVKNGLIELETMRKSRISKEQLFARLREEQLTSLGEVKRVYLETNGGFSIFKFEQPRIGLSVYPQEDAELVNSQQHDGQHKACSECGFVKSADDTDTQCPNCKLNGWTGAVYPKK